MGLRAIRKEFAGEYRGGKRLVSCVLLVPRHERDLDEARRADRELANDSDPKRRFVKAVIGISNTPNGYDWQNNAIDRLG
jgi:hypothetical protein